MADNESALPPIVLSEPVVIPAVPERRYDEAYIVNLWLDTLDAAGSAQPLTITLRPYNQDTAELFQDGSRDVQHAIGNVWAEAARVPLFAQVMGGIVTVTSLLVQERSLAAKLAGMADDDPGRAAVAGELAAVHSAMGMV